MVLTSFPKKQKIPDVWAGDAGSRVRFERFFDLRDRNEPLAMGWAPRLSGDGLWMSGGNFTVGIGEINLSTLV